MAISRRALGLGLLATAAVGTGGFLAVKDRPEIRNLLGDRTRLFGFIGGEKQSLLADPDIVDVLNSYSLTVDERVAGSVEMVRETALLSQNPQFLWPSSSVMVDLVRKSGVAIRNDQVVLNSPIVVYTWEPVVEGLMKSGLASVSANGGYNELDLKALLDAILAGKSWSDLGVDRLYGRARIISTDPTRSNSGFMFAGLTLNLMSGDVATPELLVKHGEQTKAIFRTMGLKSSSSGKLFDQYIAGGLGAEPMVIGYENQLVEWALADPACWQRVQDGQGAKPAILYPRPTVYSVHPLIVIDPAADRLLEALMSEPVQQLAWSKHGFRGPLGRVAGDADAIAGVRPAEISAVLPMPSAEVMLSLLASMI